jgi:hypothetical protein
MPLIKTIGLQNLYIPLTPTINIADLSGGREKRRNKRRLISKSYQNEKTIYPHLIATTKADPPDRPTVNKKRPTRSERAGLSLGGRRPHAVRD